MNNVKILLKGLRDGVAYSFSWLVICVTILLLISGKDTVTVDFLVKVLLLCFWGSLCFSISFRNKAVLKRGFMFSLTCFYILFIPVEILMFYLMGIFQQTGGVGIWSIFAGIVVILYVLSLIIDRLIMLKKAEVYTEKLAEYNMNNSN